MKKDRLLQIRIDEGLLEELKTLAEENSLPVSTQVRMIIKNKINER